MYKKTETSCHIKEVPCRFCIIICKDLKDVNFASIFIRMRGSGCVHIDPTIYIVVLANLANQVHIYICSMNTYPWANQSAAAADCMHYRSFVQCSHTYVHGTCRFYVGFGSNCTAKHVTRRVIHHVCVPSSTHAFSLSPIDLMDINYYIYLMYSINLLV